MALYVFAVIKQFYIPIQQNNIFVKFSNSTVKRLISAR